MSEQNWQVLARVYLAAVFMLLAFTVSHYGLTWDEDIHRMYGDSILQWYSSFFKDTAAVDFPTLHFYGGFFDTVSALAAKFFPFGAYESRHFANVFFGFLAIFFSYRLGKHFSGEPGGFFSALFLTLTPVFYGHIFNNPKDIPFAALFLAALYYLILSYDALPKIPGALLLKMGTALGLMLGVRIGGVFILGYVGLLWGLGLLLRFVAAKGAFPLWADSKRVLASSAGILALSWCVMLLFWPWAQNAPFHNPWNALTTFSDFDWPLPVFYYGDYVSAKHLPWDYLPTWFLISLPEFYFVTLLAGCVLGLRFFAKGNDQFLPNARTVKILFLSLIVTAPVLGVVILRPTIYDGLRQFLFLIPPLAVLAGISFAEVIRSDWAPRWKGAVYAAVAVFSALTVWDMAALHPYENIYFNRLVAGGIAKAARNFETDYWGNSYKEGAEWLIRNSKTLFPDNKKIRVANASRPFLTGYFLAKTESLRQRFETVNPADSPDVFIAITRWHGHESQPGKVLHTVERRGVPLLYVIQPDKKQGSVAAVQGKGYTAP